MNKQQEWINQKQTENKYTVHGATRHSKRKRNVINLNAGNTDDHEMEKTRISLQILRNGHEFITEAKNKQTGFIHDVVDLNNGTIYEVETTEKRAKRFEEIQKSYNVDINVIKLWNTIPARINMKLMKKVKELGHCLCDIKKQCPCNEFLKEHKCKCGVFKT